MKALFEAESVPSNSGTYRVFYVISGKEPGVSDSQVPPTNRRFDMAVVVVDSKSYNPLDDVELAVDAAMPHHGHGMNVGPKVSRHDEGSFRVEGMLFHMPGRWELYFDITRNGVTERAQTEVFLE